MVFKDNDRSDYLKKENENITFGKIMMLLCLFWNHCVIILIVLKNVSLDYLLKLAEKWCVPEWLIQLVKERIESEKQCKLVNKPFALKFLEENVLFTCKICGTGFKLCENTKTSCRSHKSSFSSLSQKFDCCGKDENGLGVEGYHVPFEDIKKLKEYEEIIEDIPEDEGSDDD